MTKMSCDIFLLSLGAQLLVFKDSFHFLQLYGLGSGHQCTGELWEVAVESLSPLPGSCTQSEALTLCPCVSCVPSIPSVPALLLLSLSRIHWLCFLACPQTCMDTAGSHRVALCSLTLKPLLFLHSYWGQCPSRVGSLPCHPCHSCLPFQCSLPLLPPGVTCSVTPH